MHINHPKMNKLIFHFSLALVAMLPGHMQHTVAVTISDNNHTGWLRSNAPGITFSLHPVTTPANIITKTTEKQ